MSKPTIALCSCPRLGFMDFMGVSLIALAQNGVAYANLYGVYWAQSLSEGIKNSIAQDFEYIITTDYDSLYTAQDVKNLITLMDEHPEADCISTMQMGRFNGVLGSGNFDRAPFETQELVPLDTAHFGLTIFRASAFDTTLKKPWFHKIPNSNGDWTSRTNKVDEDIFFWKNFKDSGKKLFLAPRVTIGHMELLVMWPDKDMNESYQTLAHYRENGKPEDAWK